MGSFAGGYMFKIIGSIASFKILSAMALVTCVTQIIVNHMVNHFCKNEDVKDKYDIVETKEPDTIEKNTIALI